MEYIVGKKKVVIIGAGFVGSSIAYSLALKKIPQDIFIIDLDKDKATGEVWDIRCGLPDIGMTNIYSGEYSDCVGCDMIILAAGRNRKIGETRLDMIYDNIEILYKIVKSVQRYYSKGVLLVVSNPVDILTQKVAEWMQLSHGYVFGTGCILDTSRFLLQIADHLNINADLVNGYIVGEHGDGQLPIWSKVTVGGMNIADHCYKLGMKWTENERAIIAQTTKIMGAEIIKKKGKTHYGIANCICYLADAILNNNPITASVSSVFHGEYGIEGVALSAPSVIGKNGVEKIIYEEWAKEEHSYFLRTANSVKALLCDLKMG